MLMSSSVPRSQMKLSLKDKVNVFLFDNGTQEFRACDTLRLTERERERKREKKKQRCNNAIRQNSISHSQKRAV
ncbi:hypothetical protein PUN28_005458 [Cardiocondyla obscurior]|uniref:Uncharacterized protein n=1 Tax=Cardiocondyla obscurior TaxID=286306 RepID=A0AAW2GL08_9HYME